PFGTSGGAAVLLRRSRRFFPFGRFPRIKVSYPQPAVGTPFTAPASAARLSRARIRLSTYRPGVWLPRPASVWRFGKGVQWLSRLRHSTGAAPQTQPPFILNRAGCCSARTRRYRRWRPGRRRRSSEERRVG